MDNTLKNNEKVKKQKKSKFGEDYEFSPVRQNVTSLELYGGLMSRAAVASMLTWGLLLFINDSFKLGVKSGFIFLFAFAFGMSFGMIGMGKKLTFIGLGILALTLGIEIFFHTDILPYTLNSVSSVLNTAAVTFREAGYENVETLLISLSPTNAVGKSFNIGGVYILAALIALITSLSLVRRTFVSPVVLISAFILIPGITYNLPDSNSGFAITVVSLFGILTMKIFDNAYKAKSEDKKRRSSLGGFAGGAVSLLALLCIIIPSTTMKSQWTDIKTISKPMSVARDIVTSVISGDMPNLGEMGIVSSMDEQNSRKVDPKKITYTGKTMMTLEKSYYKTVPVYLRGWVADGAFDGYTWYSPSNDTTDEYNALLSETSQSLGMGEVFNPDSITTDFYKFLGEEYSTIGEDGFADHAKDGYYIYNLDVDIVLGSGTGNLLYLPSIVNTDSKIMDFESTDEYSGVHKQFYDGMVLTNWFNLNKSYSVNSYVTTFAVSGSAKTFFDNIKYVQACTAFMRFCVNAENAPYTDILNYKMYLKETYNFDELYPESTFFEDFLNLPDEEKQAMYNKYVVMQDLYTYHVNQKYKNNNDSGSYISAIANIVNQLDIGKNDTDYEKIVKCVQYLATNFTYTLNPEPGAANNLTPYEKFLSETRQGSCVQYATTLTLMLRKLGFPARYVEGFIAQSFSTNDAGKSVCNVKDENAHAWVEVYFPSYGWLTIESTSRYAKSFFGSDIKITNRYNEGEETHGGGGSSTPTDTDFEKEEELPQEEIIDPEVRTRSIPWKTVIKVFILIAVFAGGGFLLYRYLNQRAKASVYQRKRLIETAIFGADDDEFRDISHNISSDILLMLNIGGYAPNTGELPSEYAKRMDETCMFVTGTPFSEIMALIQKQEFGLEKNSPELKNTAEYLDLLWKDVYKTLRLPQKLWYRYIKLWI